MKHLKEQITNIITNMRAQRNNRTPSPRVAKRRASRRPEIDGVRATTGGRHSRSSKAAATNGRHEIASVIDIRFDDEDDATDIEWEVDQVMSKQVDADGNTLYLLKWKNWDGPATWEPEDNCDCKALIEAYKQKVAQIEKSRRSQASRNSSSPKRSASDASISNDNNDANIDSPQPPTPAGKGGRTRPSAGPSPKKSVSRVTRSARK